MANEARQQPSAAPGGEVLVPGDPEYRIERVRAVEGIPVEPGLRKDLGLGVGTRVGAASARIPVVRQRKPKTRQKTIR
jgi:hypothetical protein